MKKQIRILKPLLALLIALFALYTGCTRNVPSVNASPLPVVTQAPEVDYSIIKVACFWPQDADPENCDYSLYVEKPEFSQAFTAGYALNRAVDDYVDKLTDRVETDYIPSAIIGHPYTHVTSRVERIGTYTNIVFTEEENYEAQPYQETYVLMLDERGNEINLCDVFRSYHAEQLIADRIAELINGDSRYYPVDIGKVIDALDIIHGAKITPTGALVYIHEGLLAPEQEGELTFEIEYGDICPDFVGDGKAISYDEYIALTNFLGMVCDSVIVRGENIEEGVLSGYAATVFMAEASQLMNIVPQAGRINVPETDFEEYYRSCFGTEFPGIDTEAHDIKHQSEAYSILNKKLEYSYFVDMLSIEWTDSILVISGDITFGTFGYAFTAPVCHVTAQLERSENSPFGFTVKSFEMKL